MRSGEKLLARDLEVTRLGRSYIEEIAFTSLDPGKAAKIANAFSDAYVEDQLQAMARKLRALESRAGKGCFIAERRQVFSKEERARRLEEALSAFVNEAAYLGFAPDAIRTILERRLAQLNKGPSS